VDQLRVANLALQEALVADPRDQSAEIARLHGYVKELELEVQNATVGLTYARKLEAQLAQLTKERDQADLAAAQWEFAWKDTYAKAQAMQAHLAQRTAALSFSELGVLSRACGCLEELGKQYESAAVIAVSLEAIRLRLLADLPDAPKYGRSEMDRILAGEPIDDVLPDASKEKWLAVQAHLATCREGLREVLHAYKCAMRGHAHGALLGYLCGICARITMAERALADLPDAPKGEA
jgi:hypothetical protein